MLHVCAADFFISYLDRVLGIQEVYFWLMENQGDHPAYLLIVPESVLRHCRRHAYDWPYSDRLVEIWSNFSRWKVNKKNVIL